MVYGRVAVVDLEGGRVWRRRVRQDVLKAFLGGRGVASLILYLLTSRETEPLSPKNPLIVMAGPVVGLVPAGAKTVFTAKSPLSNGLGYSVVGGGFGFSLRRAGFDGLVLLGRASEPSVLVVSDGDVWVDRAGDLWGLRVYEVRRRLLGRYGREPSTAVIGPAGENLVRYASIIVDEGRAAARTGMGAVLGSKMVKAIVARGGGAVPVARAEEARELFVRLARKALTSPKLRSYRTYGTMSLIPVKNEVYDLPSYNHLRGSVNDVSRLLPEYAHRELGIGPGGCRPCPIACGRRVRVNGVEFEGLEYETIDSLGPLCGITDVRDVARLNYLVNDLGMDSISTGKCVAWAIECSRRGLGLGELPRIEWGDVEGVARLINDIAYRRGPGSILAEGVRRAAEVIGCRSIALHVKGVEVPAQEPRAVKAFALGHATSNRGADHLYALPCIAYPHNREEARRYLGLSDSELDELNDGASPRYKALAVAFSENLSAVSDSLGLCKFTTCETLVYSVEDLCEMIEVSLGLKLGVSDVMGVGERVVNLERLYNVRLGIVGEDRLPERFVKEGLKLPDGRVSVVELEEMLSEYYRIRGWGEDGVPRTGKLEELGIPGFTSLTIDDVLT
ncbi:MAG: hypothetical protein B6U73_02240 [Desulfurococcales archaeon ex4484_204]|nr:MAG: hypothetical protein B6U73_02240 [Desulfurococcales archaeon ex4484_204]